MDVLILLALALAPGVAIGLYIYLKDRHEREPIKLLIGAFSLGVIGVLITIGISIPLRDLFTVDETNLSQQAVRAFFSVGLLEELIKFLFVRFIFYRNRNFNEPFDGIVYSVMVGMGFATFENLLYVFDGGMSTALLRMFTAVPAHASFAILMGFFLGKAKFEYNKYDALYALLVPTLFHGMYDYFWFISYLPGIWSGAVGSLLVAIYFARKAIHIHQLASPFRPQNIPQEPPNNPT
jgi:protease PrsW